MKIYEAVIDYLERAGVTLFAGMVGSTSAPYVVEIATRPALRYIPVRHEQVGAAIVDAVGRLDRRPACLVVHGASGALAASLGIASAALDSVPMLVLSATQERLAMERGYWQTTDVLRPMSGFVKWQTRVERPDQAVGAIRTALRATVSGRPGVAQVDIPIDVSTADADDGDVAVGKDVDIVRNRVLPDPRSVTEAARIIEGADRLCLLVGGGVMYNGASEPVTRLAELLNAPVVNTPTSRGVIAEDHELAFGPSGLLGYEPANRAVSEADTILAVGSRLSDLQTARGTLLAPHVTIIQVDVEPTSLAREHPVALEVVADAGEFSRALVSELEGRDLAGSPGRRRAWVRELREAQEQWAEAWLGRPADSTAVEPAEVITELLRQLPRTAILTHGAGDHGFYGYVAPVRPPGAHLVSAALGAMGCSLGYAMGAKLARPEQTVVACAGDGELMHQIGDLETMVREHLPVIVVVFNNFRLGSQLKRLEVYGEPYGVDHTNPDFARLAELFGADGYRIDAPGEFAPAFAEAMKSGRAAVIDVIVDRDARPPRIAISREAR